MMMNLPGVLKRECDDFISAASNQALRAKDIQFCFQCTVTQVRIWNSMKNYDETVIRLNVVDNLNADLLPDRYFWPAVVICRPWKNKAERFAA